MTTLRADVAGRRSPGHSFVEALARGLQQHRPVEHEADDRRREQRHGLGADQGGVVSKPRAAYTLRSTSTSTTAATDATPTKATGICTQRTNGSDRNV